MTHSTRRRSPARSLIGVPTLELPALRAVVDAYGARMGVDLTPDHEALNIAMGFSLIASTGGIGILPLYARNLLPPPWSVGPSPESADDRPGARLQRGQYISVVEDPALKDRRAEVPGGSDATVGEQDLRAGYPAQMTLGCARSRGSGSPAG